MIAAALRYAARGRTVFPCAPNAKEPLTARGFHHATTDPAQIERWWRRWPRANVAIPTGARSGIIVIDLDVRDGRDGFATLAGLERDLGTLPATLRITTPSGGEHRYFRAPIDVVLRNSAGRVAGEDAPGFDVRGEGGYVLAPPSIVGGRPYVVRDRMPLADLPARWIAALSPPKRELPAVPAWQPRDDDDRDRVSAWCRCAVQDEARALADAPPGTRNDRLWRAAAALGGLVHTGAIDASDVRAALAWACSRWERRDPRKDADTLERGLAFGLANPRTVNIGDRRAA